MRVALFGGSFNPPHNGHLALARAVQKDLGLDRVVFVPAARPPHKPGEADMAPPQDRLSMTRLAVEGLAGFEVNGLELDRQGPSYTVDTVRALQQGELAECELYFVIGADTVGELPTWKEAEALLSEVRFVTVNRPGHDLEEGLATVREAFGAACAKGLAERVVTMLPHPASSTEIRRRVLLDESITDQLPARVAEYIRAKGLYRRHFVADSGAVVEGTPKRASVRSLKEHVGTQVELCGWIYKYRGKGKIAFLHLRDGTGIVQAILKRDVVGKEALGLLKEAGQESAVKVRGTVRADERAPGGVELAAEGVELVSAVSEEYPIALQDHGIDFLLSKRHLWLRSAKQHAVIRVRSEVCQAIRDFFYERDFVLTDAPVFTPAACEGTSNLFEVDYFDDTAYLTQSGQLYMEATAMAHGKVYCFGPTFRAERSKTRRHLTEFWMVEPEIAYGDLEEVMELSEEFLKYVVGRARERCAAELKTLGRDAPELFAWVEKPFAKITYDEAVVLLNKLGREFEWGDDFGAPDETAISEHFASPVLIHRYPRAIKAFYMAPDPDDERLALCVDVIAPEGVGEVIGGGERATDLAYLEGQIAKHELSPEAFGWYLDLRRFGSVPHAGFGLGLERTVAWICGREHVREAIPFPRTLYRKEP